MAFTFAPKLGLDIPSNFLAISTTAFVISLPLGYALSGKLFKMTQSHFIKKLLKLRYTNPDLEIEDDISIFYFWFQADLAARFGTEHMYRRRRVKQADIPLMKSILAVKVSLIQRGMFEFPDDPNILLLNALYHWYVFKEIDMGHSLLSVIDWNSCPIAANMHASSHLKATSLLCSISKLTMSSRH